MRIFCPIQCIAGGNSRGVGNCGIWHLDAALCACADFTPIGSYSYSTKEQVLRQNLHITPTQGNFLRAQIRVSCKLHPLFAQRLRDEIHTWPTRSQLLANPSDERCRKAMNWVTHSLYFIYATRSSP